MNNFTKLICFLMLFNLASFAQERGISSNSGNWLHNWTEFSPNKVDYDEPTEILSGNIENDLTLSKRNIYLLMGNVFVTNNATLTIEPGTIILGDAKSKASLTITRGAKIIANGSETDPIVFTSSNTLKKSGDWGGLIILGDAPTNKFGNLGSLANNYDNLEITDYSKTSFGGENINSNSGVLNYVRVEYAGKVFKTDELSSALCFAGVGVDTRVNNVMVAFSESMSFNFLGGELNTEKLVSLKAKGTDYNFNYGVSVKLNNVLAVRSPYISAASGSKCLNVQSFINKDESDFYNKETSVIANNITVLTDSNNIEADLNSGLIREAVFVGSHTNFQMSNSIISGFSKAVLFDNDIKINGESLNKIQFTNSSFNNCAGNIFIEYSDENDDLEHWYGNPFFSNVYSKVEHQDIFIDPNGKRPDYRLRINNIVAANTNN